MITKKYKNLKLVYQTQETNCFSACLSTLLGIHIYNIPNFYLLKNNFWPSIKVYLRKFNLTLRFYNPKFIDPTVYYSCFGIGFLPSGEKLDSTHSVICFNKKVIHDPAMYAIYPSIKYKDLTHIGIITKELK